MAEWISGNVFIRPNELSAAGGAVAGHAHNFDHTSFFQKGWFLVRGVRPDGTQIVQQFCSPEYRAMRQLLLEFAPDRVKRAYRMPDGADQEGRAKFSLLFAGPGDVVPADAVEIPFAPVGFHALIKADIVHEIAALSDEAQFACVYSHREPQGDVSEVVTGWYEAYL